MSRKSRGKTTVEFSVPEHLSIIGWREWLTLPELGITRIKAKIDTGARSSALHAFDVETFERQGKMMVRFKVHPYQRDAQRAMTAEAELIERRHIRSSSGHLQLRPVIKTTVALGSKQWSIELTLTNRDVMGFRMLLGRQAVRQHFLVAPGRSFIYSSTKSCKIRNKLRK
ncbi:MAG: ATP-dependent zinc protease [Symploca sp. SIO3C6]|uniref:ATP-dependent zinc protease n=1 Tax=Symploca sp. SIO1C4 TaxID=2607765 RepID=A0A6B3NI54_9CYAN|nr:ATP-dependent zinc protease [Symploca sp. SIO3C6]NER29694.1 ATP-dependent zinc protease [Symploca sp. SIO1C4]NET04120.1 ATP-dependent zinc protease [Symploca sp. SIO2B6]NET51152.1 ATP-dependent zinc protease [Merismopedia sp. SIO2A8]